MYDDDYNGEDFGGECADYDFYSDPNNLEPKGGNLDELTVKKDTINIEQKVNALIVDSNSKYEFAANLLKQVKAAKKEVVNYWKPAKEAAAKAHKELCAKEKAMTSICDRAEKILKSKMLAYSQKIEAERKAREEEQRRAQQAEADKLLAEAAKAEQSGDTVQASVNMAMAEQVAQMNTKVQVAAPKVSGVSKKKVWKVKIVDETAVPAYVNGICVRPVNERSLLQLHKLNPNIKVDGVEFVQEETLAVR